jgi:hypothetical protein
MVRALGGLAAGSTQGNRSAARGYIRTARHGQQDCRACRQTAERPAPRGTPRQLPGNDIESVVAHGDPSS